MARIRRLAAPFNRPEFPIFIPFQEGFLPERFDGSFFSELREADPVCGTALCCLCVTRREEYIAPVSAFLIAIKTPTRHCSAPRAFGSQIRPPDRGSSAQSLE